jgi:glycosyltransferase involved in cell wall biosynthesis
MQSHFSLVVHGWKRLTHSFSLVNSYQLLSLKRLPVDLYHLDAFLPNSNWRQDTSYMDKACQESIDSIPRPPRDFTPDFTYTIRWPLVLNADRGRRHSFIFSVNEYQELSTKTVDGNFHEAQKDEAITIVTPSQWSAEGYRNWGFRSDRVVVIPHGVDTNLYRSRPAEVTKATRGRLGFSDSDFIFLSAGTMTFNKGVDLLVRSFLRLARKYKNIRLILKDASFLGYPSAGEVVKTVLQESESSTERFLNRISIINTALTQAQMAELYSASNCYVSPYRAEGFALTPLEAAASGIDVIVTKGGASSEYSSCSGLYEVHSKRVVEGGRTYLEPELESLEVLMELALSNPLTPEESWARYRTINTNFSWDIAGAKLYSLINSYNTLNG